jgi:hypothetical protein
VPATSYKIVAEVGKDRELRMCESRKSSRTECPYTKFRPGTTLAVVRNGGRHGRIARTTWLSLCTVDVVAGQVPNIQRELTARDEETKLL